MKALHKFKSILFASALVMTLLPSVFITATQEGEASLAPTAAITDYEVALYWQDQINNPNKSVSFTGATAEPETVDVTSTLVIEVAKEYTAENMEIQLPYELWKYRNGDGAATFLDAGISTVPGGNPNVPFYYTLDVPNNKIIIRNSSAVLAAQKFTIDFRYRFIQPKTVDLSTALLQAKATATAKGESAVVSKSSQTIQLTFNSSFKINTLTKSGEAIYFWDTSKNNSVKPRDKNNQQMPTAPADFYNYNWVRYVIDYDVTLGQTLNAKIIDTLKPSDGGEIIAYQTTIGAEQWVNGDAFWNPDGSFSLRNDNSNSVKPRRLNGKLYLFVRYPQQIGPITYKNDATLFLDGEDNKPNQKKENMSASKNYIWTSYLFPDVGTVWQSIFKIDDAPTAHTLDLFQLQRGVDILHKYRIINQTKAFGYSNVEFDADGKATIKNGPLAPSAKAAGLKVDVYDDMSEWNKDNGAYVKMDGNDYSYASVKVDIGLTGTDRRNGRVLPIKPGSLTQPIATLYAMVDGSSTYQSVGTLNDADYDALAKRYIRTFTGLPPKTVKIKVSYTAIDECVVNVSPTMTIKASSPQLATWNIPTINELNIRNYGQIGTFDQDGKWLNPQTNRQGNQPVYQDGKYLQAAFSLIKLSQFDVKPTSGTTKKVEAGVNSPDNQWITYDVNMAAADGYSALSKTDVDTLKASGVGMPDTKKATFYDLLPFGMSYQNDSVKAQPAWSYVTSPVYIPGVEVETINNYKGTGRQMAIFKVDYDKLNNPKENGGVLDSWYAVSPMNPNAYWGDKGYYTGFKISYRMVLPWDNIYISLQSDMKNYFAYQKDKTVLTTKPNVAISNVLTDEGKSPYPDTDKPGSVDDGKYFPTLKTSDDKFVFALLRNGTTMLDKPDTLYNVAPYTIEQIKATQVGLKKLVRSDEVAQYSAYDKFSMTPYDSQYSYKLQLTTSDVSVSENMILFDVLETAKVDGNSGWKGVYKDVDVSQLKQLGIDPQIYYTTSSNPTFFKAIDIINNTVPAEWSKTKPANNADIKAIAIDATKGKNGLPYRFEPKSDVSAFIIMKAPAHAQATPFAYNNASYVSKLINTGEENFLETDATKIGLYEVGKLVKSSDIGTGSTAEDAAVVQVGNIITYKMYFELGASGTQKLSDVLPDNLELVKDSMYYNIGGEQRVNVITNPNSYDSATRTLTWPQLNTGKRVEYEFKAMVRPVENQAKEVVMINKAKVVVNGKDTVESNPTAHVVRNRWVNIEKNAYPIVGGNPTGPHNGALGTPYSVDASQIVEYKLKVSGEGAKKFESGQLVIDDVVPVGCTLVGNSIKGTMSKVSGSQASGENSGQFTSGKVTWTLNKMEAGDVAELTFRVSAPMMDQSTFDNTANLLDVQKQNSKVKETVTTVDGQGNYVTYKANDPLFKESEYKLNSNTTYHIVNADIRVPFSFVKVAADDNKITLPGAVFDVFTCKSNTGACEPNTKVGTFTSDANGLVDVGTLAPGKYTMVETMAPPGYDLLKGSWTLSVDKQTQKVTITPVKDAPDFIKGEALLLPNKKTKVPPCPFSFVKVDANDHKSTLPNAVFELFNCKEDKSVCEPGSKVGTYTSDANGVVDLGTLATGQYVLVEKSAPEGYDAIGGGWYVSVDAKNKKITIESFDGATNFVMEDHVYKLPNKKTKVPPCPPTPEKPNKPCRPSKKPNAPASGDTSQRTLLVSALVCSGVIVVCSIAKKRKKKK